MPVCVVRTWSDGWRRLSRVRAQAERNNGRAAMMGITGMIIHEALTGNPVFPIGESL